MLSGRKGMGEDEDDDGGFKTASLRRFGSGTGGPAGQQQHNPPGSTVADRLREKFASGGGTGSRLLTTSQASMSQQFLASSVEYPWERSVHSNHVPYYIK
jgi:hypothetical protein